MRYDLLPLSPSQPEINFWTDNKGRLATCMEFSDLDTVASLLSSLAPDPFGRRVTTADLDNYLQNMDTLEPVGPEGEFEGRLVAMSRGQNTLYMLTVFAPAPTKREKRRLQAYFRAQLSDTSEAA